MISIEQNFLQAASEPATPSPMEPPRPRDLKNLQDHTRLPGYANFEQRITGFTKEEERKARCYFQRGVALVEDLKIPYTDWYHDRDIIYAEFAKRGISWSYTRKIIRMLNQYGEYAARREGRVYLPLGIPRGVHKERIRDQQKNSSASGEMTPELLREAELKLSHHQYNWLRVSYYFGLRPSEVDALLDGTRHTINTDGNFPIVWIYQKKLSHIPKHRRWKLVPAIEKEQQELLEVIKNKELDRPLAKTLHKYLGKNIHLYAGRKGFTGMMLKRGYKLQDLSHWLGHSSTEITKRIYVDHMEAQLAQLEGLKKQ